MNPKSQFQATQSVRHVSGCVYVDHSVLKSKRVPTVYCRRLVLSLLSSVEAVYVRGHFLPVPTSGAPS